ncbi:MAG TPA: DNA polymerase III subunit alpha [Candidatus Taylorbacteria bacterium]|nr:MAG: polymerase III alpha subunit protein [Parcubacteria group bacterium GW2011_GWC2_48_17]HBV01583.1 DNA polymerase III subunit alpha [Candidatus Taylorbacteria bacterium]
MPQFTPLNVHSHYSLLNALPKIPDLVKHAKKLGCASLALTDNGNLYGALEFYKECKKEGIKPIIGMHAYMAIRSLPDKQAGVDNRRHRLIILAKNETGYRNLIKLSSRAHMEGFYYKPRIDRKLLEEYAEGLIAIAPAFDSDIRSLVSIHDEETVVERVRYYRNLFGEDGFYFEISRHREIDGHDEVMKEIIALGEKHAVPLLASQEVYYLLPEEKKARDTLLLINSQAEPKDFKTDDSDFSFPIPEKMDELFKDLPQAIENTERVANMCALHLTLGKWVFPDYKTKDGKSYDDELESMVLAGMERRKMAKTPQLQSRVKYELGVIRSKGYAPYFLVVADLLRFAHEQGILTTIRGSVAGSMVTYLAGITNVDPFLYKLPFERFLNPERPSAPDIDMDFADNRRDEMIEYAKRKYGEDKVAQIGTFGTMMARGSVRDIARAMGFEYSLGDRIAKLIPFGSQGFPMSIDRAIELVQELKSLYESDESVAAIINMAKKIEGCARHISVHAAGVVISPTALTDFVPLQLDPKGGKLITQYDMHAVEDAGLLKFDFLGIKNLSILADAVERVKRIESRDIDIENVALDDRKTFEMLTRGETGGLFQLNGGGITRYLKELRPSSIHDINAMISLYRPGPMENIPQYIERKHNPILVQYFDPRLREILAHSYGVITYQDDVLLIAIKLGGYSWLEVDKLRKAMGKKIPVEMEAQKEKLIAGFIKGGLAKEKAEKLWKLIEPFAAYGFNKAHAASYGKVAYQTAYMKANFPAIYMSAVLTAESGDVEKIGEIINECRRMNIPVLPPSINESYSGFTVVKAEQNPKSEIRNPKQIQNPENPNEEDTKRSTQSTTISLNAERSDCIRFGLMTIKNFGEGISHAIIAERKSKGVFKSLSDFLERVKDRNLNKKSLEALIKAGALDELGERGQMLSNIELLLLQNKQSASMPANQDSLFGLLGESQSVSRLSLEPAPVATIEERLRWEKELLGLYISGHPLDKFRDVLEKREFTIKRIKEEFKDGMIAVVGGIIEEQKPIITKKNDMMAFLRVADLSSAIEVVVFPKVYEESKKLLTLERCVAIKGRYSTRNGVPSLIAEKIKELK